VTRRGRRLTLIGTALAIVGCAAALALFALKDSIVFFYGPTEIVEKHVAAGTRLRIGGLVQPGSVQKGGEQKTSFAITDNATAIAVSYVGLLPDLFREGQGVVAEGHVEPGGTFTADTVLAKHDENYMPREVVDTLKKQGHWQETAAPVKQSAR